MNCEQTSKYLPTYLDDNNNILQLQSLWVLLVDCVNSSYLLAPYKHGETCGVRYAACVASCHLAASSEYLHKDGGIGWENAAGVECSMFALHPGNTENEGLDSG